MLEREIEKYGDAIAFKKGFIVRKLKWDGRRGAPDKFYAGHGTVILVEYKRPGKKEAGLSAIQKREIARLRDCGVEVHVIDSKEEVRAIFKRFQTVTKFPV